MLTSGSTLGAKASPANFSSDPVAPETALLSINSRLIDLSRQLSASSAHLQGTADRLLGAPPLSDGGAPTSSDPYFEVQRVHETISDLLRLAERISGVTDRLSQL